MDTLDLTPPETAQTRDLPAQARQEAPAQPPTERVSFISPPLWAVVAFLVSRLIMLTTGWGVISRIGVRAIGKGMYDHRHGIWHGFVPERLADPWANWDGQWFIRIASDGYHRVHSEAFFPLYPFIIRYVSYVTGNYVLAGTVIAWVAIALTLWLLYRMVAARFDATTAAWTVAFLSFFPTSFYLTSVYSESLFLLFSVAAFYFAERRHWALAGLAGMLSVLTRNTGLLLVIPLALLMVEQEHAKGWHEWTRAVFKPRTLWLLLLPLGHGHLHGLSPVEVRPAAAVRRRAAPLGPQAVLPVQRRRLRHLHRGQGGGARRERESHPVGVAAGSGQRHATASSSAPSCRG